MIALYKGLPVTGWGLPAESGLFGLMAWATMHSVAKALGTRRRDCALEVTSDPAVILARRTGGTAGVWRRFVTVSARLRQTSRLGPESSATVGQGKSPCWNFAFGALQMLFRRAAKENRRLAFASACSLARSAFSANEAVTTVKCAWKVPALWAGI